MHEFNYGWNNVYWIEVFLGGWIVIIHSIFNLTNDFFLKNLCGFEDDFRGPNKTFFLHDIYIPIWLFLSFYFRLRGFEASKMNVPCNLWCTRTSHTHIWSFLLCFITRGTDQSLVNIIAGCLDRMKKICIEYIYCSLVPLNDYKF